jgi:hypothetical protein
MTARIVLPAFAALLVGPLLAGCSAEIDTSGAVRVDDAIPTTVSGAELAAAAEGVVAEQGFDVDIDCGTADVPLEVGAVVECAGVETASGAQGSYTITITSVDGADYGIEVVGSEAEPTEPTDPAAALESAQAFANLVAGLIAEQAGEDAVVDCGVDDIEIFVGQEVRCAYETASFMGVAIATVTEFDGSNYSISVVDE